MQLIEVRDLAQRPASNLSVIVNYLFKNNMPGEFIPGHEYQKGDPVYTISPDGLTIKLWVCNISGAYPNVKEPHWTEFSINSFLDERLEKIVRLLYDPHPQMYSLAQTCGSRDISKMGKSIFELENTPPYMDVFYDGKIVPPDECEIINGELHSTSMTDDSKIMVDFYTPSHNLSRLIRRVSYIGNVIRIERADEEGYLYRINLPVNFIDQYVSYGYEVYIDGLLIPAKMCTIVTDDDLVNYPYINITTNHLVNADGDVFDTPFQSIHTGVAIENESECVVNFMVSVSDNIMIHHDTYEFTVNRNMDSYDIDITNSGYINVFQTMTVFINNKRVDSKMFHYSKGFLNVKEEENYLKNKDMLMVSVMSFVPTEYKYSDINHEDRRYITESIYTVENNTKLIPIPFMDFDEDLDDFIVFNENGALISSAKYYIDNDYIRYYSHDQGVYIGDTLNFKMIDRNRNTTMRTFILTAKEEDQTEFLLPDDFLKHDYMFTMVFYSAGAYLSPKEYTIETKKNGSKQLTLTHDMTLDPDDRLEVIAFEYPSGIGSTSMECHRVMVMEDVTNTFKLNFQFDPAITSFLIFANTGLYIGEKFYEISDDNILTITGEQVYLGGWIDIIVVQSTGALTSADNILGLL